MVFIMMMIIMIVVVVVVAVVVVMAAAEEAEAAAAAAAAAVVVVVAAMITIIMIMKMVVLIYQRLSNTPVYLRDGQCSENCTCCHTETEVADQNFFLVLPQDTDTGPTSPSTDPIAPGA